MVARFYFLIIFMFLGLAPTLSAVELPLDLGSLGTGPGQLDIARDSSFETSIVTIPLDGRRQYRVTFDETAVYYVRILRQGKVIWREAIFVLVKPSDPAKMPRLEWVTADSNSRVRIWLSRDTSKTLRAETRSRAVRLDRIGAPWLIRLRSLDEAGATTALKSLQFRWVSYPLSPARGQALSRAEPAREMILDPSAPDDDQVGYEPDDAELLAGDEGPMDLFLARIQPRELGPLERRHVLKGWIRLLRESFSIDKKDRFAADPSQGLGNGLAAQYFLAPNLSFSGAVDLHATQTIYEEGGSEPPALEQKRIRAHLGLGLDLLNTNNRWTEWSFNLGPVLSLIQIPLQEDDQKFTDGGLKLSLHSYEFRASLNFLLLKSSSRELDLQQSLPWTVWSIRPFFSLYRYDTRQSAGSVTGVFKESGLRLGIEREF